MSVMKLSTPLFCNETSVGLDYGCLSASLPAQLKYTSNPFEIGGLTRRNNYFAEDVFFKVGGASNALLIKHLKL